MSMISPASSSPQRAPASSPEVRVLVLARYPAVRAGLGALLTRDGGIALVSAPGVAPGWIGSGDGSRDSGPRIDVVVADLGSLGDTATDSLAEDYAAIPVVLLGGDPATSPPLPGRATAWLSAESDSETLVAAVRAVATGLTVIEPSLLPRLGSRLSQPADPGGEPLTPREREVLELVAEGLPNKTIARELGISEHTAKFHVGSLLAKLQAGSRTEAVTTATRRGLLTM